MNRDFRIENDVLVKYTGHDADLTIPEGVTSIGKAAFEHCSTLVTLVIPASVTEIECEAFKWCTALTTVVFSGGLKTIRKKAFSNCHALDAVELPESLSVIEDAAFIGCKALSSIRIPQSVTELGMFVFSGCEDVTVLAPEESAAAKYAKENRIPLNGPIKEPEKPQSKKEDGIAFGIPAAPKPPVVSEADPQKSSRIQSPRIKKEGSSTDDFQIENGVLVKYKGSRSAIIVPDAVSAIGAEAFAECKSIETILLPNHITSIGEKAFFLCKNLTTVNMPAQMHSVGSYAFCGCTRLKSMEIAEKIESVGEYAFLGCAKLGTVTVRSESTRFENKVFAHCNILTLKAPKGSSAERYARANNIHCTNLD